MVLHRFSLMQCYFGACDIPPDILAFEGHAAATGIIGWLEQLKRSVRHINEWIVNGRPVAHWIGGFFRPKMFIIALMQEYARYRGWTMDHIYPHVEFMPFYADSVSERPREGVYVYGLALEGAIWSTRRGVLHHGRGEADDGGLQGAAAAHASEVEHVAEDGGDRRHSGEGKHNVEAHVTGWKEI